MSARLSAKRYVPGGTTRVFKKLSYIMLAVILRPCFSPDDRVIERGDVKRLALSPSSFHNNRTDGVIKEPTLLLSKRAGDVNPGSVVCLSLTGGGGGGWLGLSQARITWLHTASVTI